MQEQSMTPEMAVDLLHNVSQLAPLEFKAHVACSEAAQRLSVLIEQYKAIVAQQEAEKSAQVPHDTPRLEK